MMGRQKYPLSLSTAGPVIGACLIAVLAYVSYQRNELWHSELLLWSDSVGKSPHKSRPFNSLGTAYANVGDYAAAAGAFLRAISNGSGVQEEHYFNLARVYSKQGRYDAAVEMFRKALDIQPRHAAAHYHLAVLYRDRGQYGPAEQELLAAVRIAPDNADYHGDLGNVYYLQRKYDLAIASHQQSCRLAPDRPETLYNLAIAFDGRGDREQALHYYTAFLRHVTPEWSGVRGAVEKRISELGRTPGDGHK